MKTLPLTILLSGATLITACATAPNNLALVDELQLHYERLARAGDAAEQLLSCRWCAGPFLNFLALHEQRKLENSDKLESLKITFWPFAVAGGFL